MRGVLLEQAGVHDRMVDTRLHRRVRILAVLLFFTFLGSTGPVLAVQQHELALPGGEGGHGATMGAYRTAVYTPAAGGSETSHGVIPVQHTTSRELQGTAASNGATPSHGASSQAVPSQSAPEGTPGQAPSQGHGTASPPALPAHPEEKLLEKAEPEIHGGHGPVLPEISPVPGVTFVETMVKLLDHELNDRTLGWRPNDVFLGRFTDNINNYQLGMLEALRFTTLRLKDSLTRMGDADAYDPDLEQALNLLMNRATLFWFPSAETAYGEAADHFRNFVKKLETGQRSFYYRVDNLRLLIASYKDLLGNVNRSLIRSQVSWFETDDYFYYAKGVAHVYYEILRVVRVGYKSQLSSTLNALDIMDEILHELYIAEQIDPWLILDSDLDGFFANHRANLNAPLSEVAHLLGVMSSF